jgi:hypothetical protein
VYHLGKNEHRVISAGSIDDKHTFTNDRSREGTEEEVIETPGRRILLQQGASFRFGTIDEGLNLGPTAWPNGTHALAVRGSHRKEIENQPRAQREVSLHRMTAQLLKTSRLHCLMIDMVDGEWIKWLGATNHQHLPSSIVWMTSADSIGETEHGPIQSGHQKQMMRLGYAAQYWHLDSSLFGAALRQSRLAVVYTQTKFTTKGRPHKPAPMCLPPRPMSNLLLPMGIPTGAWNKSPTEPVLKSQRTQYRPCVVTNQVCQTPIYSAIGPMPDELNVWVDTDRGIRRLQAGELAKAKGLPSEWKTQEALTNKGASWIQKATCSHLWAAVLDPVAEWLTPEVQPPAKASKARPRKARRAKTQATASKKPVSGLQPDWSWEVPDLSLGGAWYQERIGSLEAAIAGRADASHLRAEGHKILDRHRRNYTTSGPQTLQLIWWEFPPESWEAIREGSSMNFLVTPTGEIKPNAPFNEDELPVAIRFFDELIALEVLIPATEPLKANCPLFCVEKPHEAGAYRCIADAKSGGQNQCMAKDPVYLSRADDILPRLYTGGWSAVADASKHFHNFKTLPEEQHLLGCIHPGDGTEWIYAGLPMGTTNSPAIACRLGNSGLRKMRQTEAIFQGTPVENTWRNNLSNQQYTPGIGHGRVLLNEQGEPSALVFSMVDDFLVHAHTQERAGRAFSSFMDHSVRLGFICQPIKTSPPAQIQKFCGMHYDTIKIPTLRIPDSKVSRGIATIDYLIEANQREDLSRLTVAVGGGFLQSLVEATPARIGQTYLRKLYDEVHDADLFGKALYYTSIALSPACLADLVWWQEFLRRNPGQVSRNGQAESLLATWGDGSGTGTGGTIESPDEPEIETWMGAWSPRVLHHTSNWKELRTLLWTLERLGRRRQNLHGVTMFYFTDNMTTYYIVQNGSSKSPELHKLIRAIKLWEVITGCRVEVIHVPGDLMIEEGTDGLSRGVWLSPQRFVRSSIVESAQALGAVTFSNHTKRWVLGLLGHEPNTPAVVQTNTSAWKFCDIHRSVSIWIPSPEIARQALVQFLEIWVEDPTATEGIFLIPRILQREWGNISRHVAEQGTYRPTQLPTACRYSSLIPFLILHVSPHQRILPPFRMDDVTPRMPFQRWHAAQADHVRGLQ